MLKFSFFYKKIKLDIIYFYLFFKFYSSIDKQLFLKKRINFNKIHFVSEYLVIN